jgi:hypothetical protein
MFKLASLLYLFISLRCLVGAGTVLRRWNNETEFVTVKDTDFVLNGRQAWNTLTKALQS